MSTPLSIRSPNFFQYTNAIAAIWRMTPWLPEQDYALAQDPDVWEKVQLDAVIKHAIQTRLHKVAGRPSRLEPGGSDDESKLLADLVEEAMECVDNLPQAKLNLAKAVFVSRTYAYVEAERRPAILGGMHQPALDWWLPMHLTDVDRRRVRLVPRTEPGENGLPRVVAPWVEVSDLTITSWTRLDADLWKNYLKLVYDDDESRLGYGRGILGAIYFYHYAKGIVLKQGLQGIEKWAQGLVVGTADIDREGSTGKTNEDAKASFVNTLNKMRAENAVILGKGDTIDVKWPSGEGGRMVLEMLEYLDSGLVRSILGSLLPFGSNEGQGSQARATVEQDATDDVLQYDAMQIDDVLSRQLVLQFVRRNKANLAKLGLAGARAPRYVPYVETRQSPKEAAEVAKILLEAGVPLKRQEVYEKTGWSVPAPTDEVIEGRPAPDPFGMPGEGGPFGKQNGNEDGARIEREGNEDDSEQPRKPFGQAA